MTTAAQGPSRAVLLAHARSGSTMLMEFLDAQPDTTFAHEIFHQQRVHLPAFAGSPQADQAALKARRDADPLGFLAGLAASCPTRIFGFKWFRGHTPAVRHAVIADPAWRVMILYRENFLALHASQLTARLTGHYALRPGAAAPPAPRLPFDPDAFTADYAAYRRYYDGVLAECDRQGKAFLLLEYRQLSRPEFLRNAARHIGVAAPVTPASRLVKQGSPDLATRFGDPALVRRTVEGIGRGHWMTEVDDIFGAPQAAPPP
jgi:LPS sulfotransferase NodH